ncbi:MAG TPA: HAD-IA family hydrolase [Micromonosporaceae bacterium]|nr:HAD-IA family hydrolase [Micromonosporaceae bacterium]
MTASTRRRPTALLIDMDGVLRVFDREWDAGVERRHGLAAGSLMTTAFAPERVTPAVLGRMSHHDWMAGVGTALGAPAAVAEWQTYHGEIDPDVRSLVLDVRAAGIPVGLATNGTDRLDADLADLGIADLFDTVVNASSIGVAKPHPEFFAAACRALGVLPAECLFVDDSARFVAGARAAGLLAYRYTGVGDLRYVRAALGV